MNLNNWRKHTKLNEFNMTMLLYPVEKRRGRRILYKLSLNWLYQSELIEISFKLILQLSFPVKIAMICKLRLGIYCFIKLYMLGISWSRGVSSYSSALICICCYSVTDILWSTHYDHWEFIPIPSGRCPVMFYDLRTMIFVNSHHEYCLLYSIILK